MKEEWISVKEILPEDGFELLAYGEKHIFIGRFFDDNRFIIYDDDGDELPGHIVTHWMPLPSPPTKDQTEKDTNVQA